MIFIYVLEPCITRPLLLVALVRKVETK